MSNQVKLFNPTVTLEQFQTAITSQAPEAEVTPVVMEALSRFKPEELIKDLAQDLAAKVEGCSKERSKLVFQAVKGLNGLCDQKDELLESCPSYKAAKAAFKEVQNTFYSLGAEKIARAIQEVVPQGISSKLMAKLEKLKASAACCVARSPWAGVYDADNSLRSELEQKEPDAKKVAEKKDHLAQSLKWAFTDSLRYGKTEQMTEEEMDAFMQKDDKVRTDSILQERNSEVREFIISALPTARKEAIAARKDEVAAKEKLLAEREAALKTHLAVYLEAFGQFSKDADYLKYAGQKEAVKAKFREIGAFCSASELYDHPKATNDSK
ncbi:MAG TPA: hypothetical protein VIJ46_01845, partial [Rhabdochlamydiaceae bacterium]